MRIVLQLALASALFGGANLAGAAVPNSFVLNEMNAVSNGNFIDQFRTNGSPRNRGDVGLIPGGMPGRSDGITRVDGNGQNWLEFLTVQGDDLGGGKFSNTLDLRGWKLEWSYHQNPSLPADPDPNKYGSGTITFSNDPLWAAVPKGTIVTFNEWQKLWYHDAGTDPVPAYHGLKRDGGINFQGVSTGDPYQPGVHTVVDFSTSAQWNPLLTSASDGVSAGQTGDWRIHVWAGEQNPDTSYKYFTFTGSVVNGDPMNPINIGTPDGGLYAVNNDNWEISIRAPNPSGPDTVIQGPIGEAYSSGAISVGADEVYRLENFPVRNPAATQADYLGVNIADYVDGTSSAFGKPNIWSGSTLQDLSSIRNWIVQGDATLDGKVDGNDLLAIQRGLGKANPSLQDGDINGSGTVDAADLALWKTKFVGSAVASSTAAPECGSLILVLTALAAARRVATAARDSKKG